MIVLPPFDPQRPAGNLHNHIAPRPLGPRRRHRRRARRRAASERQPDAPLPGAQDELFPAFDKSDGNVGALGKDRMVFQEGSELVEIIGPDILVHPENGVRISHRHGRRRMQNRRVNRADLQFDEARVAELFGERNLVPFKHRLPHIDGHQPVLMFGRLKNPRQRLKHKRLLARLRRQRLHHAARAVAAGLRLAAVAVDDLDIGVGVRRLRLVDRHDLVEQRRRVARQRPRRLRPDSVRAPAHVGDKDHVAEPVHPGEIDICGHAAAPCCLGVYGGLGGKLPDASEAALRPDISPGFPDQSAP